MFTEVKGQKSKVKSEVKSYVTPCLVLLTFAFCLFTFADAADAHGVTRRDAAFVQSIDGPAIGPFLYLGANHIVTG